MSKRIHIQIIGGGYSGLIQAYFLMKAGYSVSVTEKKPRVGGLLGTTRGENFLIEHAANAFLANQDLENMMRDVGVNLIAKNPEARKRYIFSRGKMRRWPVGLKASVPLVGFLLRKKWNSPQFGPKEMESLKDWGHRILGDELTQYLLEPAMQGVYASTAENLDASLILNSLNTSVAKGDLRGSVSPEKGMGEFLEEMQSYLLKSGVSFEMQNESSSRDVINPTILAVDLKNLRNWATNNLEGLHPSIQQTKSASLTSVTLGYKDSSERLGEGFGCLFPECEGFHSLGVLFNHSIFKNRVITGASETWILNDQKNSFSQMNEADLLHHIRSDRSRIKDWKEPHRISISQWTDKIPLYDRNLSLFLKEQEKMKAPFLLVGNYLGHLGLSKIIIKAKENVKKVEGGYFG